MAEGYEVRQVVNTPDLSGRANTPSRQIAGVGVQAPRGGNFDNVGRESEVLAQVMKMSSVAMQGYAERAQREDRIAGEMKMAEGETLAGLKKAGVSAATLEGFRGMQIKTQANEWFAKTSQDIDSEWASKPPEEFQKHLQENWKSISSAADQDDEYTQELLGGMAGDMFTRLVSKQTVTHAAWAEKEAQGSYSNLIVSESATGDDESLNEIVHSADKLLPNQSPEGRRSAQLRAVRETLDEGNFKVFTSIGGLDGIRKLGASEEELNSVTTALKRGQTQNESAFMGEIAKEENKIMLELKQSGDSATAYAQLDNLKKTYNTSPEFIRSVANKIQSEDFTQQLTTQETKTLTSPEYLNDLEGVVTKTKWGALDNVKAIAAVDALASKHKLPPAVARRAYEETISARNSYIAKQDAKIAEQVREVEKNTEIDRKAISLRGTDFTNVSTFTPEVQQRALQQERDAIIQSVMQDPTFQSTDEQRDEMIKRHVEFLRGVPIKDEFVKNQFASALQGAPLNEKGIVRQDVLDSFQYMGAMRDAGISERTIKEYVGEGYDYLNTAVEFGTGVADPKTALAASYAMLEAKREGREPPDTKAMIIDYEDKREKYFDELEPSMIGAWLGAESGSQYDQILSDQVKEAAQNSPEMDAWMKTRIKTFSNLYPNMKGKAVVKLAMKDMAQWEYVMGQMVRPVGTKSLSEEMGVTDIPGPLVSNAAMLTYLSDNGEKIWPEGTEERDWWTRIKDGATTAGNTALYEPEKITKLLTGGKKTPVNILDVFTGIGKVQDVAMAFSEKEQKLANDIKMVDVQPLQNGLLLVQLYQDEERQRPIGMPVQIPAREIGTYYKDKRKRDKLEKETIRRD